MFSKSLSQDELPKAPRAESQQGSSMSLVHFPWAVRDGFDCRNIAGWSIYKTSGLKLKLWIWIFRYFQPFLSSGTSLRVVGRPWLFALARHDALTALQPEKKKITHKISYSASESSSCFTIFGEESSSKKFVQVHLETKSADISGPHELECWICRGPLENGGPIRKWNSCQTVYESTCPNRAL